MPLNRSVPGAEEPFELSWELFGELCRALAVKVGREYDPDIIVGIAAAGVIPGAVIASMLRRDFFALKISRRHDDRVVRERPQVLTAAPPQAEGKRVLLVDEICDTGETLRLALAAVRDVAPKEVRTATSLVRKGGHRPDFFALETGGIVIFPWDREVLEGDRLVLHPEYRELLQPE